MFTKLKKKLIVTALTQLTIFTISFIIYHNITILSYINISFYVTAIFLLSALLIYTVQGGFFDVISRSFNALSAGPRRRLEEIPTLSKMVTIDKSPLVFYGLISGFFMAAALLVYYR